MIRRSPRTARGFTLLELLVSIGLVALLVAAMAAFLSDALRIRARIGESIERGVTADATIDEIERALQTCVVDDGALGVGVRGSATQLDVLHAGVAAWRLGTGDAERSLEPLGRLTVSFDEGGKRVLMSRGNAPLSPLPGEIGRVRFRYHDGERWVSSFDSGNAERLPLAIEVAIWYRSDSLAERDDAPTGSIASDEDKIDVTEVEETDEPDEPDSGPQPDRRRVIAIPDAAAAGFPIGGGS